jgi:xanthine dehydrogenase/oxidase
MNYDHILGEVITRAINACLRPLVTLDGTVITTTQGIGNVKEGVDKTQWVIAANNGPQCGYSTPSFVINMFTRLQEKERPTLREIDALFDGNIYRCTGYRPILDGFKKLAIDYDAPTDEPEIEIDLNYRPKVLKSTSVVS